jgi:hypothetical protein
MIKAAIERLGNRELRGHGAARSFFTANPIKSWTNSHKSVKYRVSRP